MPADAPNTLVLLLRKPLMSKKLGVEVMHLEGAVVYVVLGVLAGREGCHEHGVVVGEGLAAVDVCEDGDVFTGGFTGLFVGLVERNVQHVRGAEVEVGGVPG